ncbi:MAG: HU family DNA-binding protein [Balneolaceae bacterium]|nr:HU family DNA-binding protein [Balneolaceae bacterium]
MQIDKEQLIQLITDKTELDMQQVGEQLNELIAAIREAADKGQSYEIEGFGTFKMVDKKLRFSPSPSLKTEINHKYAGMQPIELIGAFKDTRDIAAEEEQESTPEPKESEEINKY